MKYIVDIKGEIEGDYEIIGKYEERPQGEWLESSKPSFGYCDFVCNQCNTEFPDMETIMGKPIYNFCPNCGADMRKGDAE